MQHSHSHCQVSLDDLQQNGESQSQQQHQYQESQNDDFLDQMLSTIPNCSWPPTPHDLPSPTSNPNLSLKPGDSPPDDREVAAAAFQYPFDEASLVSKLRQQQHQQQMNEVTAKSLLLQHQQQFLLSRRSPGDTAPAGPGMLPLPLSLGNNDSGVDPSSFKSQVFYLSNFLLHFSLLILAFPLILNFGVMVMAGWNRSFSSGIVQWFRRIAPCQCATA